MVDLTPTIAAKSDQLNAIDLMGGAITVTITKVSGVSSDQPIVINYEGDNGKPYKPSKSMRRVLVAVWGNEGEDYIGRAMTLFLDPTVKWAGQPVGGIRISHMSHIDKPFTISLVISKGRNAPCTIQPLQQTPQNSAGEVETNVPTKHVDPNVSQQTTDGEAATVYQMLSANGKSQSFPDLNKLRDFINANLEHFNSSGQIDDFLKLNNNNFYEYSVDDPSGVMNEIYGTLNNKKKELLDV